MIRPLIAVLMVTALLSSQTQAQLYDPLDAYPPRWSLLSSDCEARITEHRHESDPSAQGGVCESISLLASHGTEVLLVYPIEPVRPIDELTATLSVKGLHEGIRIGLRVRFPYLNDRVTKRPAAVTIFGSDYERVGEFQRLGVGAIANELKLKTIALRNEYGVNADASAPYVDAVVLNAYSGPGNATLRLDELQVEAMVPVAEQSTLDSNRRSSRKQTNDLSHVGSQFQDQPSRRPTQGGRQRLATDSSPAFPLGSVTRVLQYNGEPLSWIRSLGFDAVWLSQPPTAPLLSEAIQARVSVYAPAPSAPDPRLEPLLEPVAAWIAAPNIALDSRNLDEATKQIQRLRQLPRRWQRPIIGCPVEEFRTYGSLLDTAVLDAPPRVRSLTSIETRAHRQGQLARMGGKSFAVGVAAMPNANAILQSDQIAARIGTPMCESFAWHGMWQQVADALADAPDAILYRSSRPLTSGLPLDQNRSLALSFVNRFIASFESWIANATPDPTPVPVSETYTGHRFVSGPTTFLLVTSAMTRGEAMLGGDGKTLQIQLPAVDEGKLIWRCTHFNAERVAPQTTPQGTTLELVSPDLVEVLAISSDISEGGRLAQSARRFAQQVAMDRWQLANDSVNRSQLNWQRASAARVARRAPPSDLLSVARSTLSNAENLVRSNDPESALRLTRRADAWCLKSEWMLRESLSGTSLGIVSSPHIESGNLEAQVAWWPLVSSETDSVHATNNKTSSQMVVGSNWGPNRLGSGDFDRPDSLDREGWTFGRRHSAWSETEAIWVNRGVFAGRGALKVSVTPSGQDSLPGGYEGTLLLVRSPSVRVPAGQALRIDAVVRTLGFGGPHQGLLVYDSIGTQELGVLVRGRADWTPITLFRQSTQNGPVNVMFELLGGGEAVIDSVEVRVWESGNKVAPPIYPLSANSTVEAPHLEFSR